MRAIIAALLLAAWLPGARATTFSTDASDLWFNAAEAGWGVNVIQQSDTLFATFFVYGANGSPAWYVASDVRYESTQGGALVYTGALYQTSGPWFGGPFNPSSVGIRSVGSVTFTFTGVASGSVTYIVDGLAVTKTIARQTWLPNDLTGSYLGASAGTWTGCTSGNGYEEENGILNVTHNGTSITMVFQQSSVACTFNGTYGQDGRMGHASGNVTCSDGSAGVFSALEIEGGVSGVTLRASTQYGSCRWAGRLGGLRRGT